MPEHLEKIVIERIKGFFSVYDSIENYIWICHWGEEKEAQKQIQLLDLELVDSDYRLIKKYI